jgi:hypothetical protein
VEQKIVKIPKNEIAIALGRSKAAAASSVDLEKDLAIEEQGEKLEPRKIVLPAQLFDVLRRRQHGQDGGNLRISHRRAAIRGSSRYRAVAYMRSAIRQQHRCRAVAYAANNRASAFR